MEKKLQIPIGAVELIFECQEMLEGKRARLTPTDEYTAQRRRYWQMEAQRPRRRHSALPRRRAA